jgi:hypothetical protein
MMFALAKSGSESDICRPAGTDRLNRSRSLKIDVQCAAAKAQ